MPEGTLTAGWNRISLQFVLHPTQDARQQIDEKGAWTLLRSEAYLSLAFARLPLFTALARFPGSFAEEKLLHLDADSPFPSRSLRRFPS